LHHPILFGGMGMTRQEYWVLAEAIVRTEMDEQIRNDLLNNICKYFASDSDRFDSKHFMEVVKVKNITLQRSVSE
jgi:septum formation topological specificity factor MinE